MELLGIYVCWLEPRYGGGIFNDCQKDSIATQKNPVMFVQPKKWTAHKNTVFSRSDVKILTTLQFVCISSMSMMLTLNNLDHPTMM